MQRPTRIVVFGVLCLLVGAVSGLQNLGEMGAAALGPAAVPASATEGAGGAFGQAMGESNAAMRSALGEPVFRIGIGVNALVGAGMAVVLIVAGVGLLMDKRWSVWLAKVWAYVALVCGVVTVVLHSRYVMPAMASAPPGGAVVLAACMLPLLWLFPVLVLTLLGRPVVMDYFDRKRAHDPVAHALRTHAVQAPDGPPPRRETADRPAAPHPRPTDRPASRQAQRPPGQTWRDDPWNDPGSK